MRGTRLPLGRARGDAARVAQGHDARRIAARGDANGVGSAQGVERHALMVGRRASSAVSLRGQRSLAVL